MILVEQKTLVSILNGAKLIGGLVTLVRAVTRVFNSASGKMIREDL